MPRRTRPKLVPEQIAEAVRLEHDGWYQHQIADKFGVCQSTICRALRPVERNRAHPAWPNRRPSARSRPDLPRPTYSDEPYSGDESEYLAAVAAWQKRTDTRFPTACDYRQVLLSLGYRKAPA